MGSESTSGGKSTLLSIREVVGVRSIEREGFTLVEIMVALTILMLGIIVAVTIGTQASKLNRMTQKGLEAQSAASQLYELLSAAPYNDPRLTDDGDVNDLNDIANPDHSDSVRVGNKWYPVIWNVADNRLGDQIKSGYKTIKIHVLDPGNHSNDLYSITLIRGVGT